MASGIDATKFIQKGDMEPVWDKAAGDVVADLSVME